MITHINKNVICIKDIPSNLVEEAILILKTDRENTNKKRLKTKNEIIMQESNDFISDFVMNYEKRQKEIQHQKEVWRRKILMGIVVAGVLGLVILLMLSYFKR